MLDEQCLLPGNVRILFAFTEMTHMRAIFGLLRAWQYTYHSLRFFSGIHMMFSVKYSRLVVNTIKLLYCCNYYEYFFHLKYFEYFFQLKYFADRSMDF